MHVIVPDLEGIGAGYRYTLLFAIVAAEFHIVAVNNDVTAAPHADPGRCGVVGGVVVNRDIVRMIDQNAVMIVARPGVHNPKP